MTQRPESRQESTSTHPVGMVEVEPRDPVAVALQDLRELGPMLLDAAKYAEDSYATSERKDMELPNLRDYSLTMFVNLVDRLGTVADRMSEKAAQQDKFLRGTELRMASLVQRVNACWEYSGCNAQNRQQLARPAVQEYKEVEEDEDEEEDKEGDAESASHIPFLSTLSSSTTPTPSSSSSSAGKMIRESFPATRTSSSLPVLPSPSIPSSPPLVSPSTKGRLRIAASGARTSREDEPGSLSRGLVSPPSAARSPSLLSPSLRPLHSTSPSSASSSAAPTPSTADISVSSSLEHLPPSALPPSSPSTSSSFPSSLSTSFGQSGTLAAPSTPPPPSSPPSAFFPNPFNQVRGATSSTPSDSGAAAGRPQTTFQESTPHPYDPPSFADFIPRQGADAVSNISQGNSLADPGQALDMSHLAPVATQSGMPASRSTTTTTSGILRSVFPGSASTSAAAAASAVKPSSREQEGGSSERGWFSSSREVSSSSGGKGAVAAENSGGNSSGNSRSKSRGKSRSRLLGLRVGTQAEQEAEVVEVGEVTSGRLRVRRGSKAAGGEGEGGEEQLAAGMTPRRRSGMLRGLFTSSK